MEIFKLNEQEYKTLLEVCKTKDYKKAVKLVDSREVHFHYAIFAYLVSNEHYTSCYYNDFESACEVFTRLKKLYGNGVGIYMQGIDVQAGEIVKVRWDITDKPRSLQVEKLNLV